MSKPNVIIDIHLDNGRVSIHRYDDNPTEMVLTSLFVRKNRRKGNGTSLIRHAEVIGSSLGCTSMYLRAKRDSWQCKWYEKLGYEIYDSIQDIKGLVWMKKTLVNE